jgi:2-C-methyl-D-erythritol 4-phosphate cytidylyltransferase
MNIAMIPGYEENFKITTAEDLERFRRIADA